MTGPVQTGQHGALPELHQLRDFPRAVAHQDLQHERLAIIVLEAKDRLTHLGDVVVR